MTAHSEANPRGYPQFRVFIFGLEVTRWVVKVITNWTDNSRAPSTAEIVLDNEFDRWTIRPSEVAQIASAANSALQVLNSSNVGIKPEDLGRAIGSSSPPLGSVLDADTFSWSRPALDVLSLGAGDFIDETLRPSFSTFVAEASELGHSEKQRVVRKKLPEGRFFRELDVYRAASQISDVSALLRYVGAAPRYPFFAGASIFHTGDPVRIFMQDPETGLWYFKFTGFVSDWSRRTSEDNERTLTLKCEDVLRLFRFSRVTSNAGVFQAEGTAVGSDFVFFNVLNNPLSGLPLTKAVQMIVFGPQPTLTPDEMNRFGIDISKAPQVMNRWVGVNGALTSKGRPYGVGAFDPAKSRVFKLQEQETTADLRRHEITEVSLPLSLMPAYQAQLDHLVQYTDFRQLAVPGADAATQQSIDRFANNAHSQDDVVTAIGGNPQLFPVDAGALFMALPASGLKAGRSGLREVINSSIVNGLANQNSYSTRLGVLLDLAATVDFSFYATPKGHLVFEMPFYDLDPGHFGYTQEADRRFIEWAVKAQLKTVERVLPAPAFGMIDREDSFPAAAARLADRTAALADIKRRFDLRAPFIATEYESPADSYILTEEDFGEHEASFTDENIKTHVRATWEFTPGEPGHSANSGQAELFVHRIAYDMIAAYGLRYEEAKPWVHIGSPEGARVMADLTLNKSIAEALTSTLHLKPRYALGPNRPVEVLHPDGPYIATVRSVSDTIDWNGTQVETTVGTNYTRVWDGSFHVPGYTDVPRAAALRREIFGAPPAGLEGAVPKYRAIASERPLDFLSELLAANQTAPTPAPASTGPGQ